MCASRFHPACSSFSNAFHQTTSYLSTAIESEPVLYMRGALNGALKAAFGAHYILDLGLSCIPVTSSVYNGFRIAKFTVTAATFVGASISAYHKRKTEITYLQQLVALEKKLIEAQKILVATDYLLRQQADLETQAGFGLLVEKPKSPENEEAKTQTQDFSALPFYESKPFLVVKAALHGAVKASGIFYVASFLPPLGFAGNIVKNIFVGGTFIGSSFRSYYKSKIDLDFLHKLRRLDEKIPAVCEKLKSVEALLGKQVDLAKTAEKGAELIHKPAQFIVEETKEATRTIKDSFFKLAQSKMVLYFRSAVDGAVMGSGVHYLVETLEPSARVLQYLGGVGTMAAAGFGFYMKRVSDRYLQGKLDDLEKKMAPAFSTVEIAKTIIRQEEQYVKNLLEEKTGLDFKDGAVEIVVDEMSSQQPRESIELTPYHFFNGSSDVQSQIASLRVPLLQS